MVAADRRARDEAARLDHRLGRSCGSTSFIRRSDLTGPHHQRDDRGDPRASPRTGDDRVSRLGGLAGEPQRGAALDRLPDEAVREVVVERCSGRAAPTTPARTTSSLPESARSTATTSPSVHHAHGWRSVMYAASSTPRGGGGVAPRRTTRRVRSTPCGRRGRAQQPPVVQPTRGACRCGSSPCPAGRRLEIDLAVVLEVQRERGKSSWRRCCS